MISKNIKKYKMVFTIIAVFACVTFAYIINQAVTAEAKQANANENNNSKYLEDNIRLKRIKVIAHRAVYFNEPENSIHALEDSINQKVDYAEIDVQETKDGMVVLMHDKNLRRLTGVNDTVDDLSFNQIEKLNIAMHSQSKHSVERIPTLDKVIKKSKGKLKLIIEIKPYGNTDDLTKKVVDIIEKNNFVNQCMVHSMSYKILLNVKSLNPHIKTGYIVYRPVRNLAALNVDFYSVEQKFITKRMILQIHKANKKIYAWTIDKSNGMDNMIKLNVDGIITDKPSILKEIKKAEYI